MRSVYTYRRTLFSIISTLPFKILERERGRERQREKTKEREREKREREREKRE